MTVFALTMVLEGPFQRYTKPHSRFIMQRTYHAPTKSGVAGMCAAAIGLAKNNPGLDEFLAKFSETITMTVRIDRPGEKLADFHTVSCVPRADGTVSMKEKGSEIIGYHEYLCGASFTVVLSSGVSDILGAIKYSMDRPKFPVYLGTKCCTPSAKICPRPLVEVDDVERMMTLIPLRRDPWSQEKVEVIYEAAPGLGDARDRRLVYDVPARFPREVSDRHGDTTASPGVYASRYVRSKWYEVSAFPPVEVERTPPDDLSPRRRRRGGSAWNKVRGERILADRNCCVFCGDVATDVHHVTYERMGNERVEDLRSLCDLCHKAVNIVEDEAKMTVVRIDPSDDRWSALIERERAKIVNFEAKTRRPAARIPAW